ncbi:hypothetical protein C2G38_2152524 [Gigaspora rosea]|uniref:C2H2-type domain-containing protein n=1 Tax=Gigaspora rosea TaxID=44941 RepID=A0A397W765_9GLOM|nr:hypothetical protein C2G38_2152524 [Gigaspora rosea]
MSDAYLDYIEEISIEIADFNSIGPTAHIPLPETLPKCNNRIINIQNNDDWCLRWCVLGVLHPVKIHPKRNPHQLYGGFMEELNMDDIPIPVPVSTPVYKKFEANNPEIRLCIYEWHNQNECLDFCYVLERSKHKGRKYLCRYCLHVYSAEKGFKEHLPKCKGLNNAPQRAQMPVKNKSIKAFYNHKCMQPNQYRIFWNLEMLTEKLTPEEKMKLTHTERLQMHKPCGYCYVVIRMDSSLNYKIVSHDLYRGSDALEKFVDRIEEELQNIQVDLSAPAEMIMAPGDFKTYNEATDCWICKGSFVKSSPEVLQQFEETKHRLLELKEWEACKEKDHPEKKKIQKGYREALSALNYKVKDHDYISGYNSYPLMRVVSKFTADKLKCILENIGKYKAMDVGQLWFLNSFQHIGMELDKLVECLGGKIEKFPLRGHP